MYRVLAEKLENMHRPWSIYRGREPHGPCRFPTVSLQSRRYF